MHGNALDVEERKCGGLDCGQLLFVRGDLGGENLAKTRAVVGGERWVGAMMRSP